jgi:hypothetical protein
MLSSFFLVFFVARADFTMSGPPEAKTTAEILKCAEKDDVQGLHSEPYVSSTEYRSKHGQAFVAWYNPYSGEAACHVYIYTFDAKKKLWVRQLSSVRRSQFEMSRVKKSTDKRSSKRRPRRPTREGQAAGVSTQAETSMPSPCHQWHATEWAGKVSQTQANSRTVMAGKACHCLFAARISR